MNRCRSSSDFDFHSCCMQQFTTASKRFFSVVASIFVRSSRKRRCAYAKENPSETANCSTQMKHAALARRKPLSLSWLYAKNALWDKDSIATFYIAHIDLIFLHFSVFVRYFNLSLIHLSTTCWANLFRHFFTSLNCSLPLLNNFLIITFFLKLLSTCRDKSS